MSDIRSEMPVLARHEGEWQGTYTLMDTEHKILDQHKSHLICTFPDSGEFEYFQTNIYTWDDGRTEELPFPARYRDKKIHWDNERIIGYAWEVDPNSIMLTWTRKDLPNSYLYEMIQISKDNNRRARLWQWFQDDTLFQRTLIQEERLR